MATFTVRQGQSLAKIARAAGISLIDLVAANPQIRDPDVIHAGLKINLPRGKQSQGARTAAELRIASGSFSAGSFSATGVPGEGLLEVGEFFRGPGGGKGALAQGLTLEEFIDAPTIIGDAGGPALKEFSAETQQLSIAALEQAREFDIDLDPAFQEKLTAGTVTLEDVLPQSTLQAIKAQQGRLPPAAGPQIGTEEQFADVRRRPATSTPSAPTSERGLLEPEGPRPLKFQDALRFIGGVPIDRFSPDLTDVERQALRDELIANGLTPGEARRLAYDPPTRKTLEIGTIADLGPLMRATVIYNLQLHLREVLIDAGVPRAQSIKEGIEIINQVNPAFIPTKISQDEMVEFMRLIDKGMDPNMAMREATFSGGNRVTREGSRRDIATRLASEPAEATMEEVTWRTDNPITPGEERFNFRTGTAISPDAMVAQQQNWDMNVVITASGIVISETEKQFRGDEIASQVEDSLKFLRALGNGDAWAEFMINNALDKFSLSPIQRSQINAMLRLLELDPDSILRFDDIRLGGHKAAVEWLEHLGWAQEANGDIYINREVVDSQRTGGVASLFPAFGGTSYFNPDYTGPSGGGGGGGAGGFGSGGRGAALYQWRISAPSVS